MKKKRVVHTRLTANEFVFEDCREDNIYIYKYNQSKIRIRIKHKSKYIYIWEKDNKYQID